MAHINSIGAGMFSTLAVAAASSDPTFSTLDTQAEFDALFATEIASSGGVKAANTFVMFNNVRDFPELGTPANIVNVPVYGQKTSKQIQGQADAPNLTLNINFVPSEWDAASLLGAMVGDGLQHVFRFSLLNTEPTGTGATKHASAVGGLGTVQNSSYYFIGKVEAMVVKPDLKDANTATITLSAQSKFYGAYTV